MHFECSLAEERLVTCEGTIIPQAVRFADGRMIVCYSVGRDAWFAPSGASRSRDGGATWHPVACPLHRVAAMGTVDGDRALFFDQYLFRVRRNKYAAFCSETRDGGESFMAPRPVTFDLEGAKDKHYAPRPAGDPDSFFEPPVPDFYRAIVGTENPEIGGHIFGRVLRLPDGGLGLSAYCFMEGGLTRQRRESAYVSARPDEGVAEEATEEPLSSSLFFRSEDEGSTWRHAGTIGRMEPGKPFDGGQINSEGFNETGLAPTSDGRLFALMRHGSYMLLWWADSDDGGLTWGPIRPLNYPGVAPSVALMPNGVLAAAWGRPGISVGFSLDGTGRAWDALIGVAQDDMPSQKYPWIVPGDNGRLLLFYDKRKWDSERRRFYNHGIYMREICCRHRAERGRIP